jgi:NTP pyrophosphatase (non-canonical NTP hydrolase)
MESDDYEQTLDDALELWGESLQIDVAVEELSELTTELARMQRGTGDPDAVVEELADCEIILDQLAKIYGTEDVNAEIRRKMDRLRDRIQADYEDPDA